MENARGKMEEGMGFEPTKGVTLYTLSKRAPSTTRTPLRKTDLNCVHLIARQEAGV